MSERYSIEELQAAIGAAAMAHAEAEVLISSYCDRVSGRTGFGGNRRLPLGVKLNKEAPIEALGRVSDAIAEVMKMPRIALDAATSKTLARIMGEFQDAKRRGTIANERHRVVHSFVSEWNGRGDLRFEYARAESGDNFFEPEELLVLADSVRVNAFRLVNETYAALTPYGLSVMPCGPVMFGGLISTRIESHDPARTRENLSEQQTREKSDSRPTPAAAAVPGSARVLSSDRTRRAVRRCAVARGPHAAVLWHHLHAGVEAVLQELRVLLGPR